MRASPVSGVTHLFGLDIALAMGPRPADEALRDARRARGREVVHPKRLSSEAGCWPCSAELEEAWSTACEARRAAVRAHGPLRGGEAVLAEIAILKGRRARRRPSTGAPFSPFLEEAGDHARLSTYAPTLGRVLCALGDYDEAERLAERGRELGDERDVSTQALWRQVRALVFAVARRPRAGRAPRARGSRRSSTRGDILNQQGDALSDLAEVLATAGHTEEAADGLEQALERYGRKKNLAHGRAGRTRGSRSYALTWGRACGVISANGPGRSRTSARGFEVPRKHLL